MSNGVWVQFLTDHPTLHSLLPFQIIKIMSTPNAENSEVTWVDAPLPEVNSVGSEDTLVVVAVPDDQGVLVDNPRVYRPVLTDETMEPPVSPKKPKLSGPIAVESAPKPTVLKTTVSRKSATRAPSDSARANFTEPNNPGCMVVSDALKAEYSDGVCRKIPALRKMTNKKGNYIPGDYRCPCNWKVLYRTSSELNRHLRRGSCLIVCRCNAGFASVRQLISHVERQHSADLPLRFLDLKHDPPIMPYHCFKCYDAGDGHRHLYFMRHHQLNEHQTDDCAFFKANPKAKKTPFNFDMVELFLGYKLPRKNGIIKLDI